MATNQQNRKVITSFMLRFVREAKINEDIPDLPGIPEETSLSNEEDTTSAWRGVIKHIQSGAEQHFTTLAEAESFMKKYIEH
jgi:hypothetical protein